jgi:hypothetical protein
MHFKEWLRLYEASFRPEDIPPYFYVAMNTPDKINFDDLANGVVRGISGVSEDFHILKRYYDSFSSIGLIMPGQEFVRMNKVTRFMYENPHFWTQPDFSRDQRRTGSGKYWLSNAIRNLMLNDPQVQQKQGPNFQPYTQLDPKGPTISALQQSKEQASSSWRDFSDEDEAKINQIVDNLAKSKFNNVGQLSKVLYAQFQQYFPQMSDMTKQKVYELVMGYWTDHKGQNAQDKEWVLKDKVMNIPRGSKMLLENSYEKMDEIKQRWDQFNSHYDIVKFDTDDMEMPSFEFLPDELKSRGYSHFDPRYASRYEKNYQSQHGKWPGNHTHIH